MLVQQNPSTHWHKIHPHWYVRTDISDMSDYSEKQQQQQRQQQQQQNKLLIFHCYYIIRWNKSSLAGISKQK